MKKILDKEALEKVASFWEAIRRHREKILDRYAGNGEGITKD